MSATIPAEPTIMRPVSLWGDYGHSLAHGISRHLARREGRMQLERTGPFVPAISFPMGPDVVVTTSARRALEAANLVGCRFAALDLARFVRVDWLDWDRSAEFPKEMPPRGEPSAYILDRPHDEALARACEPLWELQFDYWGRAQSELLSRKPRRYRVAFWRGTPPMPDVFRAPGSTGVFVSERARVVFSRLGCEWISFDGLATEEDPDVTD